MYNLWNIRTRHVYCKALDAYECGGYDYDEAESVFEQELQRGVISAREYEFLVSLFWDTTSLC